MTPYRVEFSKQFERGLIELERDYLGFGKQQTQQYISDLLDRFNVLEVMPYCYRAIVINDVEYRAMIHRSHTIYYRVFDEDKCVFVDALLHNRMLHSRHLK